MKRLHYTIILFKWISVNNRLTTQLTVSKSRVIQLMFLYQFGFISILRLQTWFLIAVNRFFSRAVISSSVFFLKKSNIIILSDHAIRVLFRLSPSTFFLSSSKNNIKPLKNLIVGDTNSAQRLIGLLV